MADRPYTEADVRLVAGIISDRYRDPEANARDALDALAAAGRLLPEGASGAADLYGWREYVWTDPSTGKRHVLHPADVSVIVRQDQAPTDG